MRKALTWALLGVALLVVAGLGFVWLGPVQVGNKKALLDFLLGRGIEAPTAEQALAQLQVADGFRSRCTRPTCHWRAGHWRRRTAT